MKLPFPSYQTTFVCDYTMQEAIERIREFVAQKPKQFKIEKSYYDGSQNIIIGTTESRLGLMSKRILTLPLVNIKIIPFGEKSRIFIEFGFKHELKFSLIVGLGSLLAFSLFYITLLINNRALPELLFVFIIAFLLLLMIVPPTISVKSSSKSILLTLLNALDYNYNDKGILPQVQRVKFFNSTKNDS